MPDAGRGVCGSGGVCVCLCVCVRLCVCACLCLTASVHVCVLCVPECVFVYVYICISVFVCMCLCLKVSVCGVCICTCVCVHALDRHTEAQTPLFLLWPGVQTQAAACGPAPCRVEPSPPASGPGFPSACTADIRTRWALAGPVLCIPAAALASVCRVPIPSLM